MKKLATIQKITELNPIPKADRIEVASVLGWKLVVKKGEFQAGDLCVYIVIDTLLPPTSWNEFLHDKSDPEKKIRLRTVKMRGQISQGLALPMSILGDRITEFEEGDDVTQILGVEKYEKPIPTQLDGSMRCGFPGLIPKTDEILVQNVPGVMEEMRGKTFYGTVKIDGTSGTFANLDGEIHACSRNTSWLESETNTYWQMVKKYNLKEVLLGAGDIAIQGEVAGPSIQKNTAGLSEQQLFVFDVYDIRNGCRYNYDQLVDFCSLHSLPMAPLICGGVFDYESIDDLLKVAESATYIENGKPAEGIVIRPEVETYSDAISGRLSFKVMNNKYLLKHGE